MFPQHLLLQARQLLLRETSLTILDQETKDPSLKIYSEKNKQKLQPHNQDKIHLYSVAGKDEVILLNLSPLHIPFGIKFRVPSPAFRMKKPGCSLEDLCCCSLIGLPDALKED